MQSMPPKKSKDWPPWGEYSQELNEVTIDVAFNEKDQTITITDRGIGMTADEVKKYINQIAFSGATEFVEKFKDAKDANEIIGKFGLGFYSAFMVADKVEINTLSYQEGAEAVKWTCDGSTEFEIAPADKTARGTEVILHVNEDSKEFVDKNRIQGILNKYAKFLPVPIRFGTKEESEPDGEDEEGKPKSKTVEVDNLVNNTNPIWTKSPSELTDEDYKNFYRELYPFSDEPLFWIHLNVDYPFNLTGVLYFPRIKNDFEAQRNKIQLYSRQVFITDEVKDIVPEFLMLLHGVIDSPDIPLNVSRSYLQSDSNVKKINSYITKKVAEKLAELFKKERESYEAKWNDIGIFVKYGMITDEKFYEKAKDFALFENVDGKFFTFGEYADHIKTNQTDKDNKIVHLYTTDVSKQDAYIQSAKERGYDVLRLEGVLDSHFVNHIEMKLENSSLQRVDADILDKLIDKDEKKETVLSDEEKDNVKGIFEKAIDDKNVTVTVESLATDDMPVILTMPEFMRRMKDMQKSGGGGMMMMGDMPDHFTASINGNHPVVGKILKAKTDATKKKYAKQAYDLALLSQNMLSGSDLTSFIKRSVDLVSK